MNESSHALQRQSLRDLCFRAQQIRDRGKHRTISFSPKVFVPLTQLCRDFCSYCTYRRSPHHTETLFLEAEDVLEVCRRGEQLGCREALLVMGERPEERYPQARNWLAERGFDSSIHYLYEMCRLILQETKLFPHSNPGNLTAAELRSLKEVNISMGLMLENSSSRLCRPGGPHQRAPSKDPQVRLRTLEEAGRLQIPFTTGLLIGIGETEEERIHSLRDISKLHSRYGHIQEVIIQNFRAKPKTAMSAVREPLLETILQTTASARILLGENMNIQVPPNLSGSFGAGAHLRHLEAGINDWGGISPLTIDYVNPEAPWPHLHRLAEEMENAGFELKARYAVYPEFFLNEPPFVSPTLRRRLLMECDSQGYIPERIWKKREAAGAAHPLEKGKGVVDFENRL